MQKKRRFFHTEESFDEKSADYVQCENEPSTAFSFHPVQCEKKHGATVRWRDVANPVPGREQVEQQ